MKILVAGAGHGGLVAASWLAKCGSEVTVVEQNPEENLGYDWEDVFNLDCFREAGVPMPEPEEYRPSSHMTFYSPSRRQSIAAYIPPEQCTEFSMARRPILRRLIAFARANGVAFEFETAVQRPLVEGSRVTGLAVHGPGGPRELDADLVIDAAGMDSPVRWQLPERFGIEREFARDQYFTIYRVAYGHTGKAPLNGPFSIYFFPLGHPGIAWVAEESAERIDFVVGTFEDVDLSFVEQVRQSLRERHPEMGDAVCREGKTCKIPVRRPISRMVADGYAAVGDAAAMTVPIIGAGICDSIRAGGFLAHAVLSPANKHCTAAELWPYQVEFMRQIGAVHASLDIAKDFLLKLRPEKLDYIFKNKLLVAEDMISGRTGRELKITGEQLASRKILHLANLPLLTRMTGMLSACNLLKLCALNIPMRYNEDAVRAWAALYNGIK